MTSKWATRWGLSTSQKQKPLKRANAKRKLFFWRSVVDVVFLIYVGFSPRFLWTKIFHPWKNAWFFPVFQGRQKNNGKISITFKNSSKRWRFLRGSNKVMLRIVKWPSYLTLFPIGISFSKGLFSGAMLVSGRVVILIFCRHETQL